MAGYCIVLFKYMRIDEKLNKKQKLLNTRKSIIEDMEWEQEHKKFLSYGEFDRIGLERISKFSRFRDISPKSKIWVGDRQTILAYEIPESVYKDQVFYRDGDFYIKEEGGPVRSDQLFLGITILQFKDSQKEQHADLSDFLKRCKESILTLVEYECAKKDMPDIKCSVLGTLGTFGLIILWMTNQYTNVLGIVTKIRNTDIGAAEHAANKSIFLSAYTIFAQNHRSGADWEKKIREIRGEAVLHLTLKRGVSEQILQSLKKWQIPGTEIYHSAGEHDIAVRMQSSTAFSLFDNGEELDSIGELMKKYILQTNLQLCEDIRDKTDRSFFRYSEHTDTDSKSAAEPDEPLPELKNIQEEYKILRKQFKCRFPSTAGMVDTLDWLYSDYAAKISTASNEMWVSNFSYQFLIVLKCLVKFVENMEKVEMTKQAALEIIKDLLSDFERQISHIAESNNLILGTPICQFRYSGQNNLTMYAYFGIIKQILKYVYENQEVSSQAEIVPLIVADIVPIIKSNLFIEYRNRNDERVITMNLPMMSLYDPICYYPYLLHEIFHYIVPKDRNVRNEIWGCMISVQMMSSVCKAILSGKMNLRTVRDQKAVNRVFKDCILPYCYSFTVEYYTKYMGEGQRRRGTYQQIDEVTLTAEAYTQELFEKWLKWMKAEEKVDICNNPIYLFFCYLYNERETLQGKLLRWNDSRTVKADDLIIKGFSEFVDELGGIADNPAEDSCEANFLNMISGIGEQVFCSALTLSDAIKEALVDIDMVAVSRMDFAQYLLVFTKIKKELLFDRGDLEIGTQDIIRIGMVLEFLNAEKNDIYLEGAFEHAKESFQDMYCGLYYSVHKAEADQKFGDKLSREADEWFAYLRTCFQTYCLRFRIFSKIFQTLWAQSFMASDLDRESEVKQGGEYWRTYAKELQRYGSYIRSRDIRKSEEQWKERKELFDQKIFDLNIEFIHSFWHQESFAALNEKRTDRIDVVKCRNYEHAERLYEDFKIFDTVIRQNKMKRKWHFWQYEISDVGQLGNLTALIAEELKKSAQWLLGENEYPVWYRGQQSADYVLLPNIMRSYKQKKKKQKMPDKFSLVSYIKREYEEFRFRADGAQEAMERVGYTDGDYIALMQHYSAATNFLDWTEDALSALYFALEGFLDEKAQKTDKDAALYIFSPALYNYARKNMILWAEDAPRKLELEKDVPVQAQEGIPNLTVPFNNGKYDMYLFGKEAYGEGNSKPYYNEEERDEKMAFYLPVAVYVSRLNKRIQAQSGIFLAYNIYTSPDRDDEFSYMALEKIQEHYFGLSQKNSDDDAVPFLYKINIKKEEREKIASWVKAFGMSKEKCYPELGNVGERVVK